MSVAFAKHLERIEAICESMADAISGVVVKDRTWRSRTYRHCFVASEAVDWLMLHLTPPLASRDEACVFATEMLTRGWLRHVCDDHNVVRDAELFFRFCPEAPNAAQLLDVDKMHLKVAPLLRALRSNRVGVPVGFVKHRLRKIKLAFRGSALVDWLVQNLHFKRHVGLYVGRWLLDEKVIEQAGHDRAFVDGDFYYRWLDENLAARLRDTSLEIAVEADSFALGAQTLLTQRLIGRSVSGSVPAPAVERRDSVASEPQYRGALESTPSLGTISLPGTVPLTPFVVQDSIPASPQRSLVPNFVDFTDYHEMTSASPEEFGDATPDYSFVPAEAQELSSSNYTVIDAAAIEAAGIAGYDIVPPIEREC